MDLIGIVNSRTGRLVPASTLLLRSCAGGCAAHPNQTPAAGLVQSPGQSLGPEEVALRLSVGRVGFIRLTYIKSLNPHHTLSYRFTHL